MSQQTLADLADGLVDYDARELRELQLELEALDRPPSLFTRMTTAARQAAANHWRNFVAELHESREAMAIIVARARGADISPEDADKVRAQLLDLVRVFPAGLIAAANSAFPIPGTGMFTPWILHRLGLMPSRWRESHLLERLRTQRDLLAGAGHTREAGAIEELRLRLEQECDLRDHTRAQAALLTHWDANRNGLWDPDEMQRYRTELANLRERAKHFYTRKQWFLDTEGEIYGALRLSELVEDPEVRDHLGDDDLLVCHDGKTGWVALPDLLGREPRFESS
ncbi:MAG TPA: hypothetical protein VFG69_04760 [Nannocystaceae bacterium]|nr:hypothetical protein [Nannocystaceae bacterium]